MELSNPHKSIELSLLSFLVESKRKPGNSNLPKVILIVLVLSDRVGNPQFLTTPTILEEALSPISIGQINRLHYKECYGSSHNGRRPRLSKLIAGNQKFILQREGSRLISKTNR